MCCLVCLAAEIMSRTSQTKVPLKADLMKPSVTTTGSSVASFRHVSHIFCCKLEIINLAKADCFSSVLFLYEEE